MHYSTHGPLLYRDPEEDRTTDLSIYFAWPEGWGAGGSEFFPLLFEEDRITFVHIGQKRFFFFLVCKGQVIVERIQ